jgi:hypothetical protein
MKKLIFVLVMLSMFSGIMFFASTEPVQAQTYVQRVRTRNGRTRYVRVRKPSYYRRHRNRINVALGTGGGAILGGLVGGRKGALIGAGVGAGSSALYTYKIKPKRRHYRKIRRY